MKKILALGVLFSVGTVFSVGSMQLFLKEVLQEHRQLQ